MAYACLQFKLLKLTIINRASKKKHSCYKLSQISDNQPVRNLTHHSFQSKLRSKVGYRNLAVHLLAICRVFSSAEPLEPLPSPSETSVVEHVLRSGVEGPIVSFPRFTRLSGHLKITTGLSENYSVSEGTQTMA